MTKVGVNFETVKGDIRLQSSETELSWLGDQIIFSWGRTHNPLSFFLNIENMNHAFIILFWVEGYLWMDPVGMLAWLGCCWLSPQSWYNKGWISISLIWTVHTWLSAAYATLIWKLPSHIASVSMFYTQGTRAAAAYCFTNISRRVVLFFFAVFPVQIKCKDATTNPQKDQSICVFQPPSHIHADKILIPTLIMSLLSWVLNQESYVCPVDYHSSRQSMR